VGAYEPADGHALAVFTAKKSASEVVLSYTRPDKVTTVLGYYGCDFGKAN